MVLKRWLLAILLVASSGAAHAGTWSWCNATVGDEHNYKEYVTPLFYAPGDYADSDFIAKFDSALLSMGETRNHSWCSNYSDKAVTEEDREKYIARYRSLGIEVVEWDVGSPQKEPVKRSAPALSSGGGYLTVKTDTSLIDARKKYEQAVLQSQRDDAAARAKQIADAARDRADMQVKLAKMFEAMRKRGSAQ